MGCGTSFESTIKRDLQLKIGEIPPERWNIDMVIQWLINVELSHCCKIFRTHNITGDLLCTLNEEDLNKMGIRKQGDIVRFRKERNTLKLQWAMKNFNFSNSNYACHATNLHSQYSTEQTTNIHDGYDFIPNITNSDINSYSKFINHNRSIPQLNGFHSNSSNYSIGSKSQHSNPTSKNSSNIYLNRNNVFLDNESNKLNKFEKYETQQYCGERLNTDEQNNEDKISLNNEYQTIDNINDFCYTNDVVVSQLIQTSASTSCSQMKCMDNCNNDNIKINNNDNNNCNYKNKNSSNLLTKDEINSTLSTINIEKNYNASIKEKRKENTPTVDFNQFKIHQIVKLIWRMQYLIHKTRISLKNEQEVGFTGLQLAYFIKKYNIIPYASFCNTNDYNTNKKILSVFQNDSQHIAYINEICQKLLDFGYLKLISYKIDCTSFNVSRFLMSDDAVYQLIQE